MLRNGKTRLHGDRDDGAGCSRVRWWQELRDLLRDYCKESTIHGLRYIADDDLHWVERCLWTVLCLMASFGILYSSGLIWDHYQTSPTMTVLESTSFPVANIPFPGVAVCDNNRVHWGRAINFQERYLPNATNDTVQLFHRILAALSSMNFGDFDDYTKFVSEDDDIESLADIDITKLMVAVMPRCEQFFNGSCWWRNADYDCCEIFELQRTEYGYCFSFNSDTSQFYMSEVTGDYNWNIPGAERLGSGEEDDQPRPRRTSNAGQWTALRFTVNSHPEEIPPRISRDTTAGIILHVHNPFTFPLTGNLIFAGQKAEVDISAQVTYTSGPVRGVAPGRRKCYFDDDGNALGMGFYWTDNCIIECHMQHAIKYCNCSPYFFPKKVQVRTCDVVGFKCLAKFNDVFNYEKPGGDNPFFDDSVEGMTCNCMADCERMEYNTEIYATTIAAANTTANLREYVFVDVHFRQPSVVRYRTDVVFGWLELTVALGGIAGLFLGCSLISGVELIYFFTLKIFLSNWSEGRRRQRVSPQGNAGRRGTPQNWRLIGVRGQDRGGKQVQYRKAAVTSNSLRLESLENPQVNFYM